MLAGRDGSDGHLLALPDTQVTLYQDYLDAEDPQGDRDGEQHVQIRAFRLLAGNMTELAVWNGLLPAVSSFGDARSTDVHYQDRGTKRGQTDEAAA